MANPSVPIARTLSEPDSKALVAAYGVPVPGEATAEDAPAAAAAADALGYPVVLAADAHTTEDKAHLSGADIRRHENETLSNVTSYGVAIRAIDTEAVRFSG